jgi:glycosyltransferase involved in cell wall biosynthesis
MWETYFPNYADKLITIYNPVILPCITANYIPKLNGKFNIVIAASYSSVKNLDGLINALRMLSPEERNLINIEWYGRKEITPGNTSAYDNAETQIRRYNLDGLIHLKGETKDIANIMYEADAVGLFSRLEGLPNAICEAMMMGKPILMTRVSDFNNLVDDSNGFLSDWDDPGSIKNILIFSSNLTIEKLISLGKNSKIKAQKLFSPSILVERWNNVLN